ncbi:Acyl-CoA N-acyltransferase [Penicillium atrosanguineum]|uniref:Acyl-CoA N-acyltransferase n=1 Tax=Penicillium atrosanguineum TaxID=1132637 RepID=UPI0023A0DCD7|nr:Acyl-CoA N-acyltransferase [Penicillium atrosanguineum]KAJ5289467.1 Acyl-CoA N-acyltransferase [Penicillium atrosanguineum]
MHWLTLEVLTTIGAWAFAVASSPSPGCDFHNGLCPRDNNWEALGAKLSDTAKIYYPGSSGFKNITTRWSVLEEPKVNLVVVPGTEDDVAETVKFANKMQLPFLAYNGVHGAITSLGKMDHGVGISMSQLSGVKVNADGKTATIAGGTMSKLVTDELWAAGKQTVTGACECVSLLGPALGGGHGWLQGHHGLVADQFVSMKVVLANGTLTTVDASSDLWWAMKGAGHNFGIVTSLTTKVYDIEHTDWAIETITFSGDKVEAVYQAANDHIIKNGTQPVDVVNWSYWMNNADADPNNPVIVMYIIQEGVKAVDSIYTKPFHDLGPISVSPDSGTYKDLAAWTGITNSSPPCLKIGMANPRFPIYLESYNVAAQKKVWDIYAPAVRGSSPFNNSIFMFEGYSAEGVHAVPHDSTAFAFRSENLLVAPLINYFPAKGLDKKAADLGQRLRNVLFEASGRDEIGAYVNYAQGDESTEQMYGSEKWRRQRLSALKKKYDPLGRFSFYAPILGA